MFDVQAAKDTLATTAPIKTAVKKEEKPKADGSGSPEATTEEPKEKEADYTDEELKSKVDEIIDSLDGWTGYKNLKDIKSILKGFVGKYASNDDDEDKVVIEPAIKRIMTLYSRDESGDSLYDDVDSVGVKTIDVNATKIKGHILNLLKKYTGESDDPETEDPETEV